MPIPGMDRPPLPSPDMQSQMGIPAAEAPTPEPAPGLASIAGQGAPGAANPHGFLLAQVDAVRSVLRKMADAEPVFAPFAQRAEQILDTGISAVTSAPQPRSANIPVMEPGAQPTPPGGPGQMPPLA